MTPLGVEGAVRSPTYTLLEHYPLAGRTALHADLYRVRSASELESLGLRDFAQGGYLWLIEWPERGGGALPAADLALRLTVSGPAHLIEATPETPLGRGWLAAASRAA